MKALRVLAGVVAALVLVGAGGVLWLRSRFREPAARRVPSVAVELGARSIVGVFPHPDDEIKAAGLFADAAGRNIPTRMLTVTRGDGGISSARFARDDLPRIREDEVRRHGAALGVVEQEVWPYVDGHLAQVPLADLTARIAEQLRAWHPDVVVTFDPGGGFSAHPDHLRVGRAVTDAFCAVPGPRLLVYALAPRRAARSFGGERGRLVADREPAPTLAIRVDPAVKVRAWQIHRSQADYVRRFTHLPPSVLYRLYDQEYYAVFTRSICR
jgi:LmbE family N-acetylglucosaminyl deacetylase